MPRLRVQDLLPVKLLVFRAWRLASQRAVSPLVAAAHLPVHNYIAMAHVPFFLVFNALDVLESVGTFKSIENSVEVAAEGAVEGLLRGGRDWGPGGAAPDGSRAAAVVRHRGAQAATRRRKV